MAQLCDEFTAEAASTSYPGAPFDAAFLTEHLALLAEERDEVVGTAYRAEADRIAEAARAGFRRHE
jgi:hypothetical protein